mmetsp:Transcript_130637/g.377877  ORF Transcript_130637/g.377877 Transcript_130637/m.377877 type:complete len:526 (-) Transcript_130637:182-1759(-)
MACLFCFSRRVKDDSQDPTARKASAVLAFIGHKRSAIVRDGLSERVATMMSGQDMVYQQILADAKRRMKARGEESFPREWEVQLVRYGDVAEGRKVMIFTPAFLTPYLDDPEAMDQAFEYVLLKLDPVAMHHRYVFVYCCMGMDWAHPELVKRMRLAFDVLPEKYGSNLVRLLVLHANLGFQMSSWLFLPNMSDSLANKVKYIASLQEVCQAVCPSDNDSAREDLRRKFAFVTHRQDALEKRERPPVTFGIPLRQHCSYHGVDFLDVRTGRYFRHLPPSAVCICEALQREGGDSDFGCLFESDLGGDVVYRLVQSLDHGMPVERELPCATLWCGLKLMLDCMPQPLLTFQCLDQLRKQHLKIGDREAMKSFLVDVFRSHLPPEHAYIALYVALFLNGMCGLASAKREDMKYLHSAATKIQARVRRSLLAKEGRHRHRRQRPASEFHLTASVAAKVFAPSFLRPRVMDAASFSWVPLITELVEVLVVSVEEPEFWVGRPTGPIKAEGCERDTLAGETAGSSADVSV